MTKPKAPRRRLLAGFSSLLGLSVIAGKAAAVVRTPQASEGPFYPKPSMRMPDIDNDLVKVAGVVRDTGGEIFTLRGTIMDRKGRPMAGRRIEIWQCDVNGIYLHTRDRRRAELDTAFQGFGHDITDDAGGYVFRTIKPAVYPGRPPHIHVKVFDGRKEVLTTQFYVKGDPLNARDRSFNRLSEEEAETVSMVFETGTNGPEATVNIIV